MTSHDEWKTTDPNDRCLGEEYMQCDACGRQDYPTRAIRVYGTDTTVCVVCLARQGGGEPEDEDEYGQGECTCRRTGRGGNDPEAGWRIDRWCPVHGLDPDAERERIRDEDWR